MNRSNRLSAALLAAAVAFAPAAALATDPPGTALERAFDRLAGTNISGAYPRQSDGTPANPPGTAAERAFDRAAGTNTSGAYPLQSDGMPGNPPGTAVERALNERDGARR